MDENYCEFHWLSGQNCEDGLEVLVIRQELLNRSIEQSESVLEQLPKFRDPWPWSW